MANKQKKLSLPIEHEKEPEQDIKLNAYLYSQKGELKEVKEVEDKKVDFQTKVSDPSEARVMVAPERENIPEDVSPEELKHIFKAYEPVIRLTEDQDFDISSIPENFNKHWLQRTCRVRGKVTKDFEIHGVEETKPLCDVRVHICEVDRLIRWLPRIPDDIITKIPDIVFNPDLPIPQPIPDPVRPPRPQPDPSPFEGGNFNDVFKGADIKEVTTSVGEFAPKEQVHTSSKRILDDASITSRLKTYDPDQIRNVVRNNFDLFHPLLCYTPWIWPYFYRCDELDVVYTDMNGLFETTISYWLLGDKPDLYFWVEALIDGVWTTVYKPPIPCNTYWDYECGQQVPIDVTDPRVQWGCDTVLEGEMIWVKTIGHGTSVHHIQQKNGTGPPVQGSTKINRIGLTDKHEPTGNYRRPFGSRLYFLLQFSSALPKNQFTYYRWSFKKIKNADLSNATSRRKTLNTPMHKPYTFEYKGSGGHFHFDVNHFKLGPVSQGGTEDLYRIPPPSPYDPPVNATEKNAHWDQNTRSIAFDSELEGDGLYEFTLELFDDSGNKITDIPNEFFQIPDFDDFSPSIDAPNPYLSNPGGGTCDAFKMVLRIDNSHCEASINKLKVDGSPASADCCGFVTYEDSSNIALSFRAFHPNNFADFNFKVKKGTCNDDKQAGRTNANGMVISSVDGYSRNAASVFSKTLTPDQLLGICSDEGKAAFAERLHVDALATNGNHNIDRYNASALAAFALEPKD